MAEKFSPQLMRGSLDLMLLSILAEEPKYGYLMQQRLREVSGDMVDLQAGTLYPILHRLENEKLVKSRWDDTSGRRRKWYSLTSAGRKRLAQQARQWNDYAECIRQLIAPILSADPKPA